jgi:transposase
LYIYIQQKPKYMPEIYGKDRHQISFSSLEERIHPDNVVRFIDAFVEKIDLEKLGVFVASTKAEGRPRFKEKYFLKLYLYGYINGIRSSRKLALECHRNIEVQWLLHETFSQLPQHRRLPQRQPQGTASSLQAVCALSERGRLDRGAAR